VGFREWWHYRSAPKIDTPPPVLDMRAGRLGELMIGDSAEAVLARLGAPASHARAAKGSWQYPRWGLYVDVKQGRVDGIVAVTDPGQGYEFDEPVRAAFAPWAGTILLEHGGRELRPAEIKEAEVRRLFGEPELEDLDEDDGELFLAFEDATRARLFTFAKSGALLSADVGTP
jgi:hypothetical protein